MEHYAGKYNVTIANVVVALKVVSVRINVLWLGKVIGILSYDPILYTNALLS